MVEAPQSQAPVPPISPRPSAPQRPPLVPRLRAPPGAFAIDTQRIVNEASLSPRKLRLKPLVACTETVPDRLSSFDTSDKSLSPRSPGASSNLSPESAISEASGSAAVSPKPSLKGLLSPVVPPGHAQFRRKSRQVDQNKFLTDLPKSELPHPQPQAPRTLTTDDLPARRASLSLHDRLAMQAHSTVRRRSFSELSSVLAPSARPTGPPAGTDVDIGISSRSLLVSETFINIGDALQRSRSCSPSPSPSSSTDTEPVDRVLDAGTQAFADFLRNITESPEGAIEEAAPPAPMPKEPRWKFPPLQTPLPVVPKIVPESVELPQPVPENVELPQPVPESVELPQPVLKEEKIEDVDEDEEDQDSLQVMQESLARAEQQLSEGLLLQEPTEQQRQEAQEIEEQLAAKQLSSTKALAYILVYKLGSLEAAFEWLAYNGSDSFACVTWETGMEVLHVDIAKLTGQSKQVIWKSIASPQGDKVSWDDWKACFAVVEGDLPEVRNAKKKQMKRMSATEVPGELDDRKLRQKKKGALVPAKEDSDRKEENQDESVSEEPTASKVSGKLVKQGSLGYLEEPEKALCALTSLTDSDINADAEANSDQSAAACSVKKDEPEGKQTKFKGRLLSILSRQHSNASVAPVRKLRRALADASRSSSMPISCPASPRSPQMVRRSSSDSVTAKADEPEEDEETWTARMKSDLQGLALDHHILVEGLSRSRRAALLQLAEEAGCWVGPETGAALIVHEGEEALDFRAMMQPLRPGKGIYIEGPLTESMGRYCRGVAQALKFLYVGPEFGKTSSSRSSSRIEVYNDKDTVEENAEGVQEMLEGLRRGEILDYPGSASTTLKAAVQKVATQLGIECAMNIGRQDSVSIGDMQDFEREALHKLEAIVEGETLHFGSDLHKLHKIILRRICNNLMLQVSEVDGSFSATFFKLAPGVDYGKSLEELRAENASLFSRYASTKTGREILCSRADLQRLFEDSCGEGKAQDSAWRSVEHEFNESLRMQTEMTRVNLGLTLQYFQVCLSTVQSKTGWRLSDKVMDGDRAL